MPTRKFFQTTKDGIPMASVDEYPDEGGEPETAAATIFPGYWKTADPKYDDPEAEPDYPKDESGNPTLFKGVPSKLTQLYSTQGTTDRGIEQLLALMHKEATKHGPGTLTYSSALTDDSSRVTLAALKRGYLVENRNLPIEDLENRAKQRIQNKEWFKSAPPEVQESERRNLNARRVDYDEEARALADQLHPVTFAGKSWGDEPTEVSQEDALAHVADIRSQRARRIAAEKPEEAMAPLPDEGTLFDHMPEKESNAWKDYMSQGHVYTHQKSVDSRVPHSATGTPLDFGGLIKYLGEGNE